VKRLAAVLVFCASCAPAAGLTPKQKQLNLDSFEYVWSAIRDKHWEARPAGLGWQAIHDEFRPAVENAGSMDDARTAMNAMLERLHQSHFGVIPAEVYSDLDGPSKTHGGDAAGIDVRVLDGQAIVYSVEPSSSAALEGVRPGWEIVKIGDAAVAPILAKVDQAYRHSTLRDLILRRAVTSKLDSGPGEAIAVSFLDSGNRTVSKILKGGEPKGAFTQLGYLQPQHVWIDSKKLNANIGYVAFNFFLDPTHVMSAFGDAVQSCAQCDGFIIDLRGNPGGIGALAMGMAGWFIDQPGQQLGTLSMRDTTLKFVVFPRAKTFAGPLAILVDGTSASTSEILAGGMKDLKRARIFGSRTAAAALPSVFELLPNGDGFQYAIANYISTGGQPLEGIGVIPDVETPLTRAALLAGKDPALDAASAWITAQRKSSH